MGNRCIKSTFICHLTQMERTYYRRSALHSGRLMRQLHSQPLQSYVKDIQDNWSLLQLHTCQSITQGLEIHRLKQQVGQLQVANTALAEQVEAAQDQNVNLQIEMAELDNQLHYILINNGI